MGEADSESRQVQFDSADDTPVLVVQDGPQSGAAFPLLSGLTTIGRQPDNDVVLDSPVVSRKHAVIMESGEGYAIRDLGSTNGTYVNRQRIDENEHPLQHGDLIQLGGRDISLLFRHTAGRTLKVSMAGAMLSPVVVDGRARQAYVNGRILDPPLAKKEFDLLMMLDARRGEAVSRDEIAQQVWPERPEGDVGNHEIEQCVHRLRTRIEDDT
ncbi:MAG: FHA domain-containing protein, partial [Ardenticatenaceae bacterium]